MPHGCGIGAVTWFFNPQSRTQGHAARMRHLSDKPVGPQDKKASKE
jgi:hypothetical protein